MDKKAHRLAVLFVALFVLMRFVVYVLGNKEHQMSTTFDVLLLSAFVMLLSLEPLYNLRLIKIFLVVVTIVVVGYVSLSIYSIIYDSGMLKIFGNLMGTIFVPIFAYYVYYQGPIKSIKHNKSLNSDAPR